MNMVKFQEDKKGFSVVELVLIIGALALIALVGWSASKKHNQTTSSTNKTASSTSSSNSTNSNPYSGWKSFSLTNEKTNFKYPPTWKLIDNNASSTSSPTDSDAIQLNAPDGFILAIGAQPAGGGGDENSILSADPIKFIGQSDYLVYEAIPGTTNVSDAIVSTQPDQKVVFPTAKNNITNAQSFSDITVFVIEGTFPTKGAVDSPIGNADINNTKLIIQSASY